MKIKYLRLNKKERKDAKNKFLNTDTGKYVKKKINSSILCSILCIIFAVYLIIDSFINNKLLIEKIYSFITLGFGIALLVATHRIYIRKINDFIVKKK